MSYTILDRREIVEELGAHAPRAQEITGYCGICSEEVAQTHDACPNCDAPVIWRGSGLWRKLYGDPDKKLAQLLIEQPTDEAALHLFTLAGVEGFFNQTQAKRWAKAVRNIDQHNLFGVINYAIKKTKGPGLISHVLNITDKRVREITRKKRVKKPAPDAGRGVPRRRP
jgi:hypothetical protein